MTPQRWLWLLAPLFKPKGESCATCHGSETPEGPAVRCVLISAESANSASSWQNLALSNLPPLPRSVS